MKTKLTRTLSMLIIILAYKIAITSSFAQSPPGLSYQAVIRDASNKLLPGQKVGMKISILQGTATGSSVYTETQTSTTNINGLVTITIGNGTVVSGTFAAINWANGPYYIEVQTDPTGGSTYNITNTSQMLSVPYALYASSAGKLSVPLGDSVVLLTGNQIINGIKTFKSDMVVNGIIVGEGHGGYINNLAIGVSALNLNTFGNGNTAIGTEALNNNISGSFNSSVGDLALLGNQTGYFNTSFGSFALSNNISGSSNVALGSYAGNNNKASQNIFIGDSAGYNNQENGNQFIGYQAGYNNTTGVYNTSGGYQTLFSNTIGTRNVANGWGALYANTQGGDNTAVGHCALNQNVTGGDNTAIGALALNDNKSSGNTAVGQGALYNNTSGGNNTAVGFNAITGSNNLNNTTAIGCNAEVNYSNTMVFGDYNVVGWGFGTDPGNEAITVGDNSNNGNGATLTLGGVWTNASDSTKKFNIQPIRYGLQEVLKLRPVSYQMKGSGTHDFGFLAQEVKLILPELVYGNEGKMTLSYGQITAVLTKALQDQQKTIEKDENEISDLKKQIDVINKKLEAILQK
jgi:hypothetical protein